MPAATASAIGAHGGSYSIYRALAISSGAMDPSARPDLQDTSPVCEIGPHKQWGDPEKIVSLDPWGHRVAHDFGDLITEGIDIRPSIAITKARLTLPEIQGAIAAGAWAARAGTILVGGGRRLAAAASGTRSHSP